MFCMNFLVLIISGTAVFPPKKGRYFTDIGDITKFSIELIGEEGTQMHLKVIHCI